MYTVLSTLHTPLEPLKVVLMPLGLNTKLGIKVVSITSLKVTAILNAAPTSPSVRVRSLATTLWTVGAASSSVMSGGNIVATIEKLAVSPSASAMYPLIFNSNEFGIIVSFIVEILTIFTISESSVFI